MAHEFERLDLGLLPPAAAIVESLDAAGIDGGVPCHGGTGSGDDDGGGDGRV